jgi:cobalt/nickel transport system permease protein
MWLDSPKCERERTGPLEGLGAPIKLIATLAFIVVVVLTPLDAWRALGAEALFLAFVIGMAGIPPRELAGRWLRLLLVVGFLVALIAPAHPASAHYGVATVAAGILIKNGMALLAMLVLAGTTPFHKLLTGLRALGVPPVLVATIQFMERYRHVLTGELERMSRARRARTCRRAWRPAWSVLGGIIGMLFLRTYERAERIFGAMLARGWDGVLRSLEDDQARARGTAATAGNRN